MVNDKTNTVTSKINTALANSIAEYGEDVTNRWIKNSIPVINFYPTQNQEFAKNLNNPELANCMFDFDIRDNNRLIGRLSIVDTITSDKTYYLIICNGNIILYQLENFTKLVPVSVSMPDELMVSLIVTGANFLVSKTDGIDHREIGIPFYTYKRGIRSNGFRIYTSNIDENSFEFFLEEVDHKNKFELINFALYREVDKIDDANKQYMAFKNPLGGGDFILLTEWDFSNIFPNYNEPIFTPILAYQLLTYSSNSLDTVEPELREPIEEIN